ncbi:hypothetical protein BDV37DRAFT_276343 [Aspergillus pseudonomiae]|uniref:Uncharacterized protein n=1 Tax=Aspergillus pseudonomiae TaxID=1506151 RepID=A0A5N7CWM6_9EURO|nr:uncharacterized protein BDV37DRAFT_276343 [Aspergillus pseudonomiae]KAE8398167.1 hypothetical protein BDV37DRAFT_276343 [Aspergillus pseudonomiae]
MLHLKARRTGFCWYPTIKHPPLDLDTIKLCLLETPQAPQYLTNPSSSTMQFTYTAIALALVTAISAQNNFVIMSCNTSPIPCHAVGIPCRNENTPWACPVRSDQVATFEASCRNINAFPEIRGSGFTLSDAKQTAGCKI